MKTATIRRSQAKSRPRVPYPNAATRKEMFHKALDLMISGAIGAGLAASVLLLMVIR
jgi:hypothetical protein